MCGERRTQWVHRWDSSPRPWAGHFIHRVMSSEPPFTNLNNYDLIIRSSRKHCYSLLFQSFKGSFLKHSKTTLSRLSSLTSNTPNASATTRGFVFQTVSPSGKNNSNTKVIRLQNNFVSSLKKIVAGKRPRLQEMWIHVTCCWGISVTRAILLKRKYCTLKILNENLIKHCLSKCHFDCNFYFFFFQKIQRTNSVIEQPASKKPRLDRSLSDSNSVFSMLWHFT